MSEKALESFGKYLEELERERRIKRIEYTRSIENKDFSLDKAYLLKDEYNKLAIKSKLAKDIWKDYKELSIMLDKNPDLDIIAMEKKRLETIMEAFPTLEEDLTYYKHNRNAAIKLIAISAGVSILSLILAIKLNVNEFNFATLIPLLLSFSVIGVSAANMKSKEIEKLEQIKQELLSRKGYSNKFKKQL